MGRSWWSSAPRSRRWGIGTRRVAVLLLGACLVALSGAVSSAATPKRALSPLEQGLHFYAGKSVTFIIPAAPGGGVDQWARIVIPYMASYLHATINYENIAPGQTIPGQDTTASATPNGLTFGMFIMSSDAIIAISGQQGLNFNPAREAFICGTGPSISTWISQPTGPFGSWAAVEHSSVPVTMITTSSGISLLLLDVANAAFSVTHGQVILGYANTAAVIQGFVRGDAQIAGMPLSSAGPLVQAGKAKVILISAAVRPGVQYRQYTLGVPTVGEIAKQYPPKTPKLEAAYQALEEMIALSVDEFFAPSRTPYPEVLALRAACKAAETNAAERVQALSLGLQPGYVPGSEGKADYLDGLKYKKILAPYIPATG